MNNEDSYRDKAAEFRRRARAEANVSMRLELELLALSYDRLADQAKQMRERHDGQKNRGQAIGTSHGDETSFHQTPGTRRFVLALYSS